MRRILDHQPVAEEGMQVLSCSGSDQRLRDWVLNLAMRQGLPQVKHLRGVL